ncbi:hypothetical protein [Solibacillus sp. FSL K6-1126]|uniref:hypothetical protein n=1 Tax=Solibacillus sp. FSL K6-1126 TaxID=2921463 RepID=UPI0030FCE773
MKLKKIFPLFLYLLGFLILGINDGHVSGNTNDIPPPFEEIYPEIGYKSVDVAVDDFEQHFNQELMLPIRVPPISFTHYWGRFSDLDGEANDTLEVTFISEHFPNNHFKIDVRPIQHKISFEKYKSKEIQLKNGNNAIYTGDLFPGFKLLIFETVHWQYVFSVDEDVSDEITPEILVQIANSIDF